MADEGAIRRIFSKFDADNNGLISYEDLEQVFNGIGGFPTAGDLRESIESVKEDRDGCIIMGCINFVEFLALCMYLQSPSTGKSLQKLFAIIDPDGDRYLSKDELAHGMGKFLGCKPTPDQLEVTRYLDININGKMSYREFADSFLCRLHTILDDE